ncbi:MAG: hypothetical protein F4Y50_03140 [Dehalococcoidia bacterium]|nr:hypothetical protein [Dehalococcoidia bacterium]
MKQRKPVIDKSKASEDLHYMRLMALLQELVRDHGRKRAAAILGVDRRTLDAGLDERVLSRRMRTALDRALRSGVGSAPASERDHDDELEGRLKDIRGRVETLEESVSKGLAAVRGDVKALRNELAQVVRRAATLEPGGAVGVSADGQDAGTQPTRMPGVRREFPDLVTLEPAYDDEEVFGEFWHLIVEWRGLKETHPNRGKGLDWLTTEERFLALELTLLEKHGLTLPPETYPLRGLERSAQTNWRRAALSDTRRALRKAERLRKVRRVLTFGLW